MKYFVILSFSLAIVTQAIAIQPKLGLKCYSMPFKLMAKGGSISDRLQFGGNIGLQLGNPTTVLVSPSIGYVPSAEWFDDRLMYGLGITYIQKLLIVIIITNQIFLEVVFLAEF